MKWCDKNVGICRANTELNRFIKIDCWKDNDSTMCLIVSVFGDNMTEKKIKDF